MCSPRQQRSLPQHTLRKMGMTLDQIGSFIGTYGVTTEVHHAADSSVEKFRGLAKGYLDAPGHYVIVNYLRKSIGQEKGGHISPLAAYDADTDRFLLLDVARYKYPPVWVSAADLFAAINTTDSDREAARGLCSSKEIVVVQAVPLDLAGKIAAVSDY